MIVKKKIDKQKKSEENYSVLLYWKSLPRLEKMISATSASHSTQSSKAFFNNPLLLFENVTCLLILFSILSKTILPLPIFPFPLSLSLSLSQSL
jgi:hypothetical protein